MVADSESGIDIELQTGLLCLAVEQAFQHSNRAMAVAALETLLSSPGFDNKLLVLRCLVRLTVSDLSTVSVEMATAESSEVLMCGWFFRFGKKMWPWPPIINLFHPRAAGLD